MKQRIVPRPQAADLAKGEGADQFVGAAVSEEGLQLKRTLLAEVLLTAGAVVDLEALRRPVPAQLFGQLDGVGGRAVRRLEQGEDAVIRHFPDAEQRPSSVTATGMRTMTSPLARSSPSGRWTPYW